MNSKGNKPGNMPGNYNWNKPGNDQNSGSMGKAGKMSNPSGSKGMSGESRSEMGRMHQGGRSGMSPEQEPKREWGQKHFHGNNADWGKEGHRVENGPDLRWGETSRSHGDMPSGSSMDDDQPIHPGHASNQGQGSDISRKAENRQGKMLPKEPRELKKGQRPNTDMDWSL